MAIWNPEEMVCAMVLQIERHLDVNDGAADSAEGVRAFWLSTDLRTAPIEPVIEALDRLEKRGSIVKRQIGYGFVYSKYTVATRH